MNPVRTRLVFASLGICFIGLLMSAMLAPVEAGNPKISVAVGQSITQRVPTTIKTVSIADSDVAPDSVFASLFHDSIWIAFSPMAASADGLRSTERSRKRCTFSSVVAVDNG